MKILGRFLFALVFLFPVPVLAQHTVLVTWTASVDAATNPTLTYNVYRGATCSNLTKINTTPIGTLSYSDATATVGSLCYTATSVVNGVESVDANTSTVVILPAPPSALAAKQTN